jgi:hypothetical protein
MEDGSKRQRRLKEVDRRLGREYMARKRTKASEKKGEVAVFYLQYSKEFLNPQIYSLFHMHETAYRITTRITVLRSMIILNLYEPCVPYEGRACSCSLYVVFFLTNVSVQCFEHAAHSLFFSRQFFFCVPVLLAFFMRGVLEFGCKIPGPKG